jgi:hypothetical protein
MSDEHEIGVLVDLAYDALAFRPGDAPDWERFNSVFAPSAVLALRLFPDDRTISVLNLTEYAVAQLQHGLKEQGYSETPGARWVEVVGDVATVRQEFTMNFSDKPPVDALDLFSLVRVNGVWRVVSVLSDLLTSSVV